MKENERKVIKSREHSLCETNQAKCDIGVARSKMKERVQQNPFLAPAHALTQKMPQIPRASRGSMPNARVVKQVVYREARKHLTAEP